MPRAGSAAGPQCGDDHGGLTLRRGSAGKQRTLHTVSTHAAYDEKENTSPHSLGADGAQQEVRRTRSQTVLVKVAYHPRCDISEGNAPNRSKDELNRSVCGTDGWHAKEDHSLNGSSERHVARPTVRMVSMGIATGAKEGGAAVTLRKMCVDRRRKRTLWPRRGCVLP